MSKRTKHSPTPLPVSQPAPILVVDDDEDIRYSMRLFLEDVGYCRVAEAATMPEAFTHLHTAAVPHIVLLDFRLLDANADTLLGLVQHDVSLQRHRYILMPANPVTVFSEEAQRLINAVCLEVLTKPFDLTTLHDAVKRAEAHLAANPSNPSHQHADEHAAESQGVSAEDDIG